MSTNPRRITPKVAWRARTVRGLALPVDANYTNLRLKSIAFRQAVLYAEIRALDLEIKKMAQESKE